MKKLKLILICVIATNFCWAQEIEWQNTIGGLSTDELYSIEQTTDGGYILGGISNSDISGDKIENSIGTYDYWIIKTNASGSIQWQKTIGGNNMETLAAIKQTMDGGYILGGWSNSNISGHKTENSKGHYDYWVVKMDSSGIIVWDKTIGGNDDDRLTSIDQTPDGGFILLGYSLSNTSGDKTENSNGSHDNWLVKIDATGAIVWQNTIGGSDSDALENSYKILTQDGGFIFGGRSFSNISGDKTENSNGLADYWLIKTDSLGNIQWQNTIGGSSDDRLLSIEQTADNGYILAGISLSNISGDKTEASLGSYDYWIIKTDTIGNIQWQNTIGGNDMELMPSIIQTVDGGYLLGGSTSSHDISGDKPEKSAVTNDGWVIKTDAYGNIQWQNILQGNGWDNLHSIAQSTDGNFILGLTSGSGIGYDKTEACFGFFDDYWMIKIINNSNLITGNTFIDNNSNSIKDSNEIFMHSNKITELNTGRFSFSQTNGFYSVAMPDTGNFTVTPTQINFYNTVPVTHTATFAGGFQQTDSLNDFAFQPQGVFNDLCVTITPLSPFRAGFNASYMINYGNYGTTSLSGDVIFFPYNNVTYVSSNTTPLAVTTDSVVWSTGLLAPFQTGSIIVTVNVNVGTPIGSLINSSVRIEPIANDANPGCNYHAWEVITTGSIDPNDILVSEDTLTTTQLSAAPFLDYTIRFQNTGNDTAFIVKVLNPIDTNKLELSTIEFVGASHPVNLNWINYQRNMEFKFDNILLPDSNTNEPASHGFVHYRIKPKITLLAGDSVTNNAYIYFDFNSPVATNTAITHIVLPTGIAKETVSRRQLVVYPNPTANELSVTGYSLSANEKAEVKVFDLYGKEIFATLVTTANWKLQTGNFSKGIYFVQVGALRAKFVKR